MATLTETVIDLADCHTTLYYFFPLGAKPSQPAPLTLGTAQGYCDLYGTVAAPAPTNYDSLTQGSPPTLLSKLSPAYRNNKYWKRYLLSGQHDIYQEKVWENLIPIEATLLQRVEFIDDGSFYLSISPVPRVLLYPFGWSAWLSLRITKPHSLEDLSKLVRHIFAEKAFRIISNPALPNAEPQSYTLQGVFDYIAQGVRADAFGGNKTKDFDSQDITAVTTVLKKHGGSLSLGSLSTIAEEHILRIVNPEGPSSKKQLPDYIFRRDPKEMREYIVMNDFKRFVWLEHLLQPEGRSYEHLRCYHNNTFHSLVQARQLLGLLTASGKQKTMSSPLSELIENAANALENPNYTNASLKEFLQNPAVINSIESLKKMNQSDKADS